MTWRQSIGMAAALIGLLGIIYLWQSPYRDITAAPPEQARENAPMDARLSYLRIPITLPLETIKHYANEEIPEQLVSKIEKKRYKTRFLGISTTYKGELKTTVVRRAPVQVSTRNDWLELSIPLAFIVKMKGKGTLDPDAKSRGKVTITARFRLGINEQWQPRLEAAADYHWDKKPYLRIGPFKARVSNLIGEELEEKLDKAIIKLQEKVAKWDMRERVAERWHELHQVRPISDRFSAWLIVDPHAMYFPPIKYGKDALEIEFGLASYLETAIGTVPPPPTPEPLPDLKLTAPPEDGFSIQLPIYLDYAGILEKINAEHAGRQFVLDQGELTVKEFKLYTSRNALVVAARISAQSPQRLFNTHGWVYLTGEPRYDTEKRILYIDRLDFSRRVDNPLVSGASWILQDRLRHEMQRLMQFDLNEKIEELRQSANEDLDRPIGEGFRLLGSLDDLNLAYLAPQKDSLLLVLNARGQLAITSALQELKLE